MTTEQSGVGHAPRESRLARQGLDPRQRNSQSSELRVRLLGGFQVAIGERLICGPVLRKADELLALVLLAPQRSVRREVAADALWPSSGPAVTKKAMRQALWQIHQATDAALPDRLRLVIADGEAILVNPVRQVWVDVTAFTGVAPLAQTKSAGALSRSDLTSLVQAADLYRGPLLAGCYEDWCLVKRAHLEDLYITLLDKLSAGHECLGDLEPAIRWAQRLLEVEPAHERSHRRLMQLYYRTDDRTRALRQYRYCRWVLEHELGVRPSARTERLAAAIGAGVGSSPEESDERSSSIPESTPPLDTDVLDDLRSELAALRASLERISAQLRR